MSYLLDYENNKIELPEDVFDDIEDIALATVTVVTGDESLRIVRRNGDTQDYSTFSAWQAFYDGDYNIIKDGEWIDDREKWDARRTSYDFLYYDNDEA